VVGAVAVWVLWVQVWVPLALLLLVCYLRGYLPTHICIPG
jgi:hypothetical protein